MNKINGTVSMLRTGDTVILDSVYDDKGHKVLPAVMLTITDIDHARSTGVTIIRNTLGGVLCAAPHRSCLIIRH